MGFMVRVYIAKRIGTASISALYAAYTNRFRLAAFAAHPVILMQILTGQMPIAIIIHGMIRKMTAFKDDRCFTAIITHSVIVSAQFMLCAAQTDPFFTNRRIDLSVFIGKTMSSQ